MLEERPPLRERGQDPQADLEIERDRDRDLAIEHGHLMDRRHIHSARPLQSQFGERQYDPDPCRVRVQRLGRIGADFDGAIVDDGPPVVLILIDRYESGFSPYTISLFRRNKIQATYGAAPKALFCVSDLIAAKVFVMTATNRLISQKLRTIMATMKKKHEMKNSASIMEYIRGDH
jgi:hypothetical protein